MDFWIDLLIDFWRGFGKVLGAILVSKSIKNPLKKSIKKKISFLWDCWSNSGLFWDPFSHHNRLKWGGANWNHAPLAPTGRQRRRGAFPDHQNGPKMQALEAPGPWKRNARTPKMERITKKKIKVDSFFLPPTCSHGPSTIQLAFRHYRRAN